MHQKRRHDLCLNCEAPTPGQFCGHCGQRNQDLHASFFELGADLLGEAFEADSRIVRTVRPFLLRPGFLTNEHNAGRRARYSSPLRLYLFCSFAYFLALSLIDAGRPKIDPNADAIGSFASGLQAGVSGEKPVVPPGPRAPEAGQAHGNGPGAHLKRFADRLDQVSTLRGEQRQDFQRRFGADFTAALPRMIFVLLPLFGLLLRSLFRRAGKFYVEHLTLAFHLHAFAFVVLLPALLFQRPLATALATGVGILLIAAYVLVALRAVYQLGWTSTALRFTALVFTYLCLLSFAFVGTALFEMAMV